MPQTEVRILGSAQQVRAEMSVLLGTTAPPPGSGTPPPTTGGDTGGNTGGNTPPPPPVIDEPPSTVPAGTDIRQSYQATGSGPHVLELLVSSQDYDPNWELNHYNEIDIFDANNVMIAENIRWAARAHASDNANSMVVTIKRQNPIAKPTRMVASGTGVDGRVAIHRMTIDGILQGVMEPKQYIYYGYGGATWDGFQYLIWDDFSKQPPPPSTGPSAPPPAAVEPTVFTGIINGTEIPHVTLAQFGPMLKDGDVGELPPIRIFGTCSINAKAKLKGSASGLTILSCNGINITWGKATVVPNVIGGGAAGGVEIEDIKFEGKALNDDGGAAAIRDNGHGMGFTVRRCDISERPQGIASFQSDVTIEDSYLHENGTGDGQGHNCYAQRADDASKSAWLALYGASMPDSTFTVRRTKSDKPWGGHAIKSRAQKTIIEDCPDLQSDGNAHVVDIPNGGVCTIKNSTITPMPGPGGNKVAFTFGVEGMFNSGTMASFDNVLIDDSQLGEASYIIGALGTSLALHTSTFKGPKPTVQVFSVVGDFLPAA